MTKVKKQQLEKIAKKYQLKLILLFGSRAAKVNNKSSDFDVAYYGNKDLDLEKEAKLILEFSPVVKSENIDLVNLKKAPPLLAYEITKNCQVLYATDLVLFFSLRAYYFKRYVEEAKPLLREKQRRLREIFNV